MWADLKLAIHLAAKRPASSLTIVGILIFGVGGTTAVFSVFNGLFLRPLPFPEAERLVDVDEAATRWDLEFVSVSYPDFEAWREQNESFELLAAYDKADLNLVIGNEAPRRVRAARVTHELTRVLRIEPVLGRTLTPEEDRPGGSKVVLIGQRIWRDELGGRNDVLGSILHLDSEPHTVVGVLPQEAVFIGDAELFVPLATETSANPGSWYLSAIGRLKPNVTPESARADLNRIHKAMAESRPVNEITSPVVVPILDRLLGDYRAGTTALLVAVGFVLMMVCANVSGLMLARSASRQKEMGIRLALGAARSRVVRQMMTEAAFLTAIGGALGAASGYAVLRYLVARMPEEVPKFVRFELDARFLAFTLLVVAAASALAGLAPALRASNLDAQQALRETSRHVSESRKVRMGLRTLVVAELALAFVFLYGAGALLESFREILRVDPGFRADGVVTYRLSLPDSTYDEDAKRLAFFEKHLEDVRPLPGVIAAGAVSTAPLGNHDGWFFEAEGAAAEPDSPSPVILTRMATAGYFDALGITLLAGRFFEAGDEKEDGARVAVVNRSFAQRSWPGESALGKRIRNPGQDNPWWTVVGVARDVKHYGLVTEMRPGVYLPLRRFPRRSMTVALRASVSLEQLVPQVRHAVTRLDPSIPIYEVATMSERLEKSLWPRRVSSWLVSLFAGFALILAVAGVYGAVSYASAARTREIAIRMALGARRAQVLESVLKQGATLVVLGIALGAGGAFAAGHLLSTFLFQVSTTDVRVCAMAVSLLVFSAFLANWIPAKRASTIDPMESLRSE